MHYSVFFVQSMLWSDCGLDCAILHSFNENYKFFVMVIKDFIIPYTILAVIAKLLLELFNNYSTDIRCLLLALSYSFCLGLTDLLLNCDVLSFLYSPPPPCAPPTLKMGGGGGHVPLRALWCRRLCTHLLFFCRQWLNWVGTHLNFVPTLAVFIRTH